MFLLLAVLAALANVVGGLFATVLARGLSIWVAFATGFLIAMSVLDMVPASLASAAIWGPPGILAGYLALHLLESTTEPHHGMLSVDVHEHAHLPRATVAAVIGLGVHTFMAGSAIVAGSTVAPELGLQIAAAIALHKLPEGAAVVALMRLAGYSRGQALLAAAAVGLTTVLGAVAVGWNAALATSVLPLATGATLYVAATQLLPMLAHAVNPRARLAFLGGAVLYAGVSLLTHPVTVVP